MIELLEISGKSSLLTRATADLIVAAVGDRSVPNECPFELGLHGIVAITPSFLDQLIGGLKNLALRHVIQPLEFRFHEVPTRASSKFAAVARGHGLKLEERIDGVWCLRE